MVLNKTRSNHPRLAGLNEEETHFGQTHIVATRVEEASVFSGQPFVMFKPNFRKRSVLYTQVIRMLQRRTFYVKPRFAV